MSKPTRTKRLKPRQSATPSVGGIPIGEQFGDMIIDQFDVLYAEGKTNARIMPIGLHTFLVGQPFRAKHLERAFKYMAGHEGVWLTTGDEVNDWYRSQYM